LAHYLHIIKAKRDKIKEELGKYDGKTKNDKKHSHEDVEFQSVPSDIG